MPVSSYEEVTGAAPSCECCKFRGSVTVLDAANGKQIWKSYTIPEEPHPVRKNKQGTQLWGPSGAAVWSSPTLDLKKRSVYVTTGDAYSDPPARTSDAFTVGCPAGPNCPEAQGPDFDFGSSPSLVDLPNGKRALVADQKSGLVHAIDPDQQREVLWQTRVGHGGPLGGVEWGSATDDRNVYVALSDFSSSMARGPEPGANKTVFGVYFKPDSKAGGGMFALNLATGERMSYTPPPGCGDKLECSPSQSAAVTAIPGAVFSGALDGHAGKCVVGGCYGW